jgi:hypothetical protein
VQLTLVRRALMVCVSLSGALALPAAAEAIVPASEVTAPGGSPVYLYGEGESMLTVSGRANMGKVELRCYTAASEYLRLEPKPGKHSVPVSGEAFSATVPQSELPAAPCQLRAVPIESKAALPPGVETEFKGPLVVASKFDALGTGDFYGVSDTLAGSFIFRDAGDYGLESLLYSTAAHADQKLFFGDADLSALVPEAARPSALQVDGATAYPPATAEGVEAELSEKAGETVTVSGRPAANVSESFNEASRQLSVREEDPLVRCWPNPAFPATREGCSAFVTTGVTLVRTLVSGAEDHVALLTDTWRSSDGAAHAVSARYYMEQADESNEGAFEFPGQGAFATVNAGETRTLPAGAGTILYKERASVPDAGDGVTPQGAIVYDAPPTAALTVATGSTEGRPEDDLEMPYQRAVPAGGATSTLRMTFVQGFSMDDVRALAAGALSSYYPSVSIAAPANGSLIRSPSSTVTVSGSAADAIRLSSLAVDGRAVAVGAGGAWSAALALAPGANTITATATNQSGLSASASVTATYLPPASAAAIGRASGAKGHATFTIACHGLPGTSCAIHSALTSVERLRRKRLLGLAARRRPTTTNRRVAVGSSQVVIAAGASAKIAVPLNATGRRLLARFKKVPAHLAVALEGEGVRASVIAQNLTIEPAPKPKPRRARHRR